jgi:hypothetical protein
MNVLDENTWYLNNFEHEQSLLDEDDIDIFYNK